MDRICRSAEKEQNKPISLRGGFLFEFEKGGSESVV